MGVTPVSPHLHVRVAGRDESLLATVRTSSSGSFGCGLRPRCVYGREDMIVGRLTADEERFLTSRGASVMAVSAGHASMFEDSEIARRIAAALSQGALAPAP